MRLLDSSVGGVRRAVPDSERALPRTEAFELSDTDTEAVFEGATFAGVSLRGVDAIRVVR